MNHYWSSEIFINKRDYLNGNGFIILWKCKTVERNVQFICLCLKRRPLESFTKCVVIMHGYLYYRNVTLGQKALLILYGNYYKLYDKPYMVAVSNGWGGGRSWGPWLCVGTCVCGVCVCVWGGGGGG